jgi:hypothetical protein
MQLNLWQGYPDYIGKRLAIAGSGTGPASYVSTGDQVYLPRYNNYIDILFPGVSVSGNYIATPFVSGPGQRQTWVLRYSTVAGGVASLAIATAGSGQTPGTYLVAATGGGGAGAVASIVVAGGGTVTATPTIVSGGVGYTSAPTFTLAAGGTPATFTATLTVAGPVSAGTNLSAETFDIGGYGGVY